MVEILAGHFLAQTEVISARGVAVPTRFEADGSTLVQVVEHSADEYTYPITADPYIGAIASGALALLLAGLTSILFQEIESRGDVTNAQDFAWRAVALAVLSVALFTVFFVGRSQLAQAWEAAEGRAFAGRAAQNQRANANSHTITAGPGLSQGRRTSSCTQRRD